MSNALAWLDRNTAQAPPALRARMRAAVAAAERSTIHETLAAAALHCLQATLRDAGNPECALDLLSADALLTHACAAAAEVSPDELARLTTSLRAAHFQSLLDRSA
jgi:hypothetical protein